MLDAEQLAKAQAAVAAAAQKPRTLLRPWGLNFNYQALFLYCQREIELTRRVEDEAYRIIFNTTTLESFLDSHRVHVGWLRYLLQDEGITMKREFPDDAKPEDIAQLREFLDIFNRRISILEAILREKASAVSAQAKPTPALASEPRPPIETVAPPAAPAATRPPVQPPTKTVEKSDTLLIAKMIRDGKRINRALMGGATRETEEDMKKWIEQAVIAIQCFNEFTRAWANRTPETRRQRGLFNELRQRVVQFKAVLKDDSPIDIVNTF